MKKVLIISPYFPPCNTADMHRVRMNLNYLEEFGWKAEVITVDPKYADVPKDTLLLQSFPESVKIHFVNALSKSWTRKIGLGSLALRSLWYCRIYVDKLLKRERFDLIFFSTTEFPVCVLGKHWKKKFGIPYVIDMQDPWYSEHYRKKPKTERPKKYHISYALHRRLEPIAMSACSGLISVSQGYIDDLTARYGHLAVVPSKVIPFGAFYRDFEIAFLNRKSLKLAFDKTPKEFHVVYVGRGGYDMHQAAYVLFEGFRKGLTQNHQSFSRLRFHFIGTSYAPEAEAVSTFDPIAQSYGVNHYVTEVTARIGFYESIVALQAADALFIPGSEDLKYTASKLYPYILAEKPLLAAVNSASPMAEVIKRCSLGVIANLAVPAEGIETVFNFLNDVCEGRMKDPEINEPEFEDFSARTMTGKQCELFNEAILSN